MVAFGCILMGLGIGLILGNIEETIALSLVGLIVGSFLYTKMGVYVELKCNKTTKTTIYITVGILIGIVVGLVTQSYIGSIIIGIGSAIVALNIRTYRRNLRRSKEDNSENSL